MDNRPIGTDTGERPGERSDDAAVGHGRGGYPARGPFDNDAHPLRADDRTERLAYRDTAAGRRRFTELADTNTVGRHATSTGRADGPTEERSTDFPRPLGRYTLQQELGSGGMGVVYLATDPAGRGVAVKVLQPHIAADENARARLRREFSSLHRIDHPRVAPLVDAELDGDSPYLVTRYVPGRSLDQRVREDGPLSLGEIKRLGAGLGEALEAIHAVGVVHRDLKPTNVLVSGGDPVVIDFGIAQAADDSRLTQAGLVMGTPGYLPPEVLSGRPAGPESDWWAWAATLTYAATGRPPFGRGPLDAVLSRVHLGTPDLQGLPPQLADLLRRALSPDPHGRPDRDQLLRELVEATDTPSVPTGHASAAQRAHEPGRGGLGEESTTVLPGASTAATEHLAVSGGSAGDAPAYASFSESPVRERPGDDLSLLGHWSAGRAARAKRRRSRRDVNNGSREPLPPVAVPDQPHAMGETRQFQAVSPAVAPAPEPAPRAEGLTGRPRNGARVPVTVAVAALGLLVMAGMASFPVVTFVVVTVWAWLARTVHSSVRGVAESRAERGPRGTDAVFAVLLAPLRAVPAAVVTLLSMVLVLLVVVAGMFGSSALMQLGGATSVDPFGEIALASGAGVGLIVAWWGPGGTGLRRGTRATLRGVSPGRLGPAVLGVVLALAATYLALRLQGTGVTTDWYPLQNVISDTLGAWF